MDEKKLLEGFAKALGSAGEKALKDIEDKKLKEQKYLEGLASMLGPEAKRKLEEIKSEQAEKQKALEAKKEEIRAKKLKEQKLLDEINKSLNALVAGNPQYAKVIEQEVAEVMAELPVEEPVMVAPAKETVTNIIQEVPIEEIEENAAQPQPELPKDDIITRAVKDISKSAPGKMQDAVDELPRGLRRELDVLKKSIADLHRFATNHSQLGGGGEVKLARLDDVDFTTAMDGYYLKYDSAVGKFVFDQPTGTGGGFTNGQSISVATIEVSTALIPATNNNIDIGTDGLRFRTLYLSGNTIFIGNSTINAVGSSVELTAGSLVNGALIATNNDVATAYSNAIAYAASNSTVYSTFQTMSGLSANVAKLAANAATYLNGKSESALNVNNALTSNNASYLDGVAANGYLTTTGVNTSNGNFTYYSSASNTAFSIVLTPYAPVGNQTFTFYSSGSIGGPQATMSWPDGTLQRTAWTGVATGLFANASGTYVNASYIETLTANNSSYLGGIAASGYQKSAELSSNVATLTANAATYLNGKTESNLNVNSALVANAATYINGKTESNLNTNNSLTSNNASYLGGAPAASYLTNTGAFTISGVHTHSANIVLTNSSVIIANGAFGSAGQLLASNGTSLYYANGSNITIYYANGQIASQSLGLNAPGSNQQITFNDSGYLSTNAGLTYDRSSNTLTVGGTVSVGANVYMNTTSYFVGNSTVNVQIIATGSTFNGNVTANGLLTVPYAGSTNAALAIAGMATKGGAGYHDFLMVRNANSSATNPNKWFRLNNTGEFQIINSAYTNQLFVLDDAGNLVVAGNVTMSGVKSGYSSARPAFRVYGSTTTSWSTAVNTNGYINTNQFTVDYNQGSYLNTTSGVFTAPVAGLYQINLVCRNAANTGISQLAVVKNATGGNGSGGTVAIMIEFGASSSMNHAGGSTVLQLNANDTIVTKVLAGTIQFDSNDNWSVAYIG